MKKASSLRYLLLCLFTTSVFTSPSALDRIDLNWLGLATGIKAEQIDLRTEHPCVAIAPVTEEAVLSPEPNQLRVVDLRGVECYPELNDLQVCGTADTACFLLFTKSEERLPEIEFTIRFGEGVEYSQFSDGQDAYIDYSDDAVFPPPLTDLDVISTQNPEAPSFLISGVTRDSGSVYICYGVRAECGVDIANNPPSVMYEWRYTTESGVFCEGEYTPPTDFGGDVKVPMVQFTAPLPANVNLGAINTDACQTASITQTTPDAGAGGYIFTADEYGFDDGIRISMLSLSRNGGAAVEITDFTVDADGLLTYSYEGAEFGPLEFNDVDEIEVCYTYAECFPNVDFTPVYTVVSACDGVLCTGPADEVSNGRLISDFASSGDLDIEYTQDMIPTDQFPAGVKV